MKTFNVFYGLIVIILVGVYTLTMTVVCGVVLYWKHLIVALVLILGIIGGYGVISGGHDFILY